MKRNLPSAADAITCGRIVLSVILLFFSPSSVPFDAIYLACGLSDVLDGFFARKFDTVSDAGAVLDSIADLVFFGVCAIKLLPLIRLDRGIWLWTAVIFLLKLRGMLRRNVKCRSVFVPHTLLNKLTGVLLFFLPFVLPFAVFRYYAVLVCLAATIAALQELVTEKDGK